MSVRDFISENLPEPWDHCSRKLKMRTELIERIYALIPNELRNTYKYKVSIQKIKRLFAYWYETKVNIIYLVEGTNIDKDKWEKLNTEIMKYIEECK